MSPEERQARIELSAAILAGTITLGSFAPALAINPEVPEVNLRGTVAMIVAALHTLTDPLPNSDEVKLSAMCKEPELRRMIRDVARTCGIELQS